MEKQRSQEHEHVDTWPEIETIHVRKSEGMALHPFHDHLTKSCKWATINWTTAVPATSRVKYGLTTSYGTLSSWNSNFTTTHSVSLTALTAGTTYHYRVLSDDSTGVLVTGLDEVFTTSAATHSVALSWNASTSQNIVGYNVYRAVYSASCGSFSKINSLLNTTMLYTDSNVVDGTSYCYATTAVNTSNEESSYSNIVSNVQVPVL